MTDKQLVGNQIADKVRSSFDRQGLMRLIGARLMVVELGRVQIDLPRCPEVSQQHGYVHAGATSAIADCAGGYAALTLMPSTSDVLSVEYKLNLLAPAAGDLEAIGTVLRQGRTLTVCHLEVFSLDGKQRILVAAGQQTVIRIDKGSAS